MRHQVVWLKRDLRLADHAPLTAAGQAGPVVVLYVIEPSQWTGPWLSHRHWCFVSQSLCALDQALGEQGMGLTVRTGEVVDVLAALHGELGDFDLWAHQEVGTLDTWERDKAVARWVRRQGLTFTELPSSGVQRPHPRRTDFSRHWHRRMTAPALPVPRLRGPRLPTEPLPARVGAVDLGATALQPGGLDQAQQLLDSFLGERSRGYRAAMSSPLTAWEGTSRLSAHLAWGTLSLRTVVQATLRRQRELRGRDPGWHEDLLAFESRLAWRDHFRQRLEDAPEQEVKTLAPSHAQLRRLDPARFSAWATGRTGWPMVDACMRQLRHTGWTSFRMRAMLVSVASYPLWLPFQQPAQYLAQLFVDYDPGIHFCQVQMQAGTTGFNQLRVYDPVRQAALHDPTGVFVQRWVPELSQVQMPWLLRPWTMPSPPDYPVPLVDFDRAARRAEQAVESLRRTPQGRAETQALNARHGSRLGAMGSQQRREFQSRRRRRY